MTHSFSPVTGSLKQYGEGPCRLHKNMIPLIPLGPELAHNTVNGCFMLIMGEGRVKVFLLCRCVQKDYCKDCLTSASFEVYCCCLGPMTVVSEARSFDYAIDLFLLPFMSQDIMVFELLLYLPWYCSSCIAVFLAPY